MGNVDLQRNVSQRTPCVLVLDHSGSMDAPTGSGLTRIQELNRGIAAFADTLKGDPVALSRVQIAIVSVSGDSAELLLDWTDAEEFEPFELNTSGTTPLGAGILLALQCVEQHKKTLRENGIAYTRPWMFILTDGEPTDSEHLWETACKETRQYEANGGVLVFPVGVADANLNKLSEVCQTRPKMLQSTNFKELFVWLSASLSKITRSKPGEEINLPSTDGWSSIKL